MVARQRESQHYDYVIRPTQLCKKSTTIVLKIITKILITFRLWIKEPPKQQLRIAKIRVMSKSKAPCLTFF